MTCAYILNQYKHIMIKHLKKQQQKQCRRMNLAFTLIILIINLTVASEVHILLFLHSS